MLEDDHGIGVLQRGPEHAARVLQRRRREHLEAGDVRIDAFQAVRMLGGELAARAGRHADHQRHAELPARHVPDGGGIVEDLVQREQREIHRHDFHDRAHAVHRRTDAQPGEAVLRQRRVADALGPEFVEQPLAHAVTSAVMADILTHEEDARIALQRVKFFEESVGILNGIILSEVSVNVYEIRLGVFD